MSDKLRKTLRGILFAIGTVSTILLIPRIKDTVESNRASEIAREIAFSREKHTYAITDDIWQPAKITNDANMEELEKIDLAALKEVNPEVVGWIFIPSTRINYPILQAEDNSFYLNMTWEKKWNPAGSIFLECENKADFTDFNTIIYGHNMYTTTMFSSLRQYRNRSMWEKSPYIYIVNNSGVHRYQVFSSYETPVDAPAYKLSFKQNDTRADFLRHAQQQSVVEASVMPALTDRIITLSTCTGEYSDTRWVVHAREVMEKKRD